jgi:hypothetical protein
MVRLAGQLVDLAEVGIDVSEREKSLDPAGCRG